MQRRVALGAILSVAIPSAARGQSGPRRVALLIDLSAGDPEGRVREEAVKAELTRLGWHVGESLILDVRYGESVGARMREAATQLLALSPDVVIATGSAAVIALREVKAKPPLVFVIVVDPVGQGFVDSIARPGGNVTGFTMLEFGVSSKWLALMRDIDRNLARVAVLRDASISSGVGQYEAIRAAAASVNVEAVAVDLNDITEMEKGVTAVAGQGRAAMIVTAGTRSTANRDRIIAVAARLRLPAVYPHPIFTRGGGLMAYSPDRIEQVRQSAGYAVRILKGEAPGSLPVQAPTKYELTINLGTAKALGIVLPPTLVAGADEIVE